MPTRRILTWHGPSRRWKKFYLGKLYYLAKGRCRSDRESYRQAVAQWTQLKLQIDTAGIGVSANDTPGDVQQQPPQSIRRRSPSTRAGSVARTIDEFIDAKRSDARGGRITMGRVQSLEGRLRRFYASFMDTGINSITESELDAFYQEQTERISKGEVKPATLAQDMNAVRQLFKWCSRRRIIRTLPRNLDDLRVQRRSGGINDPGSRHLFLSRQQIQQLYNAITALSPEDQSLQSFSKDVLEVAFLLGLNCGMTQQDISDLQVSAVRLNTRPPRVHLTRAKTGEQANFIMWRKTRSLLARLCLDKSPNAPVCTRRDGTALVRGTASGARSDVLGQLFSRLVKRTLGPTAAFRFRELRRTGANMCRQRMPGVETLYLAHRDRRMASFYTVPPQRSLDQMIVYLEKDMGFERTLSRPVRPQN